MKAAVVRSFDTASRCEDFPLPEPSDADEIVVEVIAAGLHPRVRSQADGSHYTSTGVLPLVPGIDGVGRGADGKMRYFVLPDTSLGSMAEKTIVDARRSIVLPEKTDPVAVAAAMNPAMSSWVALRRRIAFQARQSRSSFRGAAGNAGRMAVQVAKLFGAGRIIAAARDAGRLAGLPALGATEAVELSDMKGSPAGPVPTSTSCSSTCGGSRRRPPWRPSSPIGPIAAGRSPGSRSARWRGPTAPIPSAALRASNLQLIGSGQGSVSTRDILAELPELAEKIVAGAFEIDAASDAAFPGGEGLAGRRTLGAAHRSKAVRRRLFGARSS